MSINRRWRPVAASALVYAVATVILGRDVLAHLDSTVANDVGDPLFTAAILKWNATHLPLTDAWWQFPIFHPTRDTLAFSEHPLGLSVIASPIYWLTGDTLVTYNTITLLTFPLCVLAMYALVYRLTGSTAGAFVAGLAFGFAPYRIAQLSHVQMLAVFWAPLALAGLHAYLDTGKRRWLALYGAAWLLQGATSGYSLVSFSVLVGLWMLWFVVARRRWRALSMIAAATAFAMVPLVPVLYKYVAVHAYHGFGRSVEEARAFSADLSAMLCAPDGLSFWGWIRAGCYPAGILLREVELFPGIAVLALCGVHVRRALSRTDRAAQTPGIHAPLQRSQATGFYLLAALATWSLALGPTLTFMGVHTPIGGPFAWLLALPGVDGLRVPARFWSMTVLCLAVVAGVSLSEWIRGRSIVVARGAVLLAALGVLADGWIDRIPAVSAPSAAPRPDLMKGARGIELPPDIGFRDTAATFRAVEGAWTTVNGYSGYLPNYYYALRDAFRNEAEDALLPFQRSGELYVLVPADAARLTALVERQPGMVMTGRNAAMVQYRLPRRPVVDPPRAPERRLPIAGLRSECAAPQLPLAIDGSEDTFWQCGGEPDGHLLTVDLGKVDDMGKIVHSVGTHSWLAPVSLSVETSDDAVHWQEAWGGNPPRGGVCRGARRSEAAPNRHQISPATGALPAVARAADRS